MVRDVLDWVAGFGPLWRWLDDPGVEEIWLNDRPTAGCLHVVIPEEPQTFQSDRRDVRGLPSFLG